MDAIWKFLMMLAVVAFAAACTVIPLPLNTPAASWDGNEQNSGEIGWFTNAAGVQLVVTPHWRDRYNDLGQTATPPLPRDAGLTAFTNGTWLVDSEHLGKFTRLNMSRRQRPP